jgi:hypothetical protein
MQTFESTQKQQAVMASVQQIAGKDFNDLDDIMGDIYRGAKQAADNGNEDAADFIKELFETKSARYRLVEMARSQHRNSLEQQSQKAQNVQAQARKSAATAVSRPGNATNQPGDLSSVQKIRDPKERLKALQGMMDQSEG